MSPIVGFLRYYAPMFLIYEISSISNSDQLGSLWLIREFFWGALWVFFFCLLFKWLLESQDL